MLNNKSPKITKENFQQIHKKIMNQQQNQQNKIKKLSKTQHLVKEKVKSIQLNKHSQKNIELNASQSIPKKQLKNCQYSEKFKTLVLDNTKLQIIHKPYTPKSHINTFNDLKRKTSQPFQFDSKKISSANTKIKQSSSPKFKKVRPNDIKILEGSTADGNTASYDQQTSNYINQALLSNKQSIESQKVVSEYFQSKENEQIMQNKQFKEILQQMENLIYNFKQKEIQWQQEKQSLTDEISFLKQILQTKTSYNQSDY